MSDRPPINALIIGQTPPPYHGQALSIQRLAQGKYRRLHIDHVRLAYSDHMKEVGKFRFPKVFHLFSVIVRVLWKITRSTIDVVHYPPAGGDLLPILRDIVTLIIIRRFTRRTLFVFHASGLYEWLQATTGILRWLAQKAYGQPNSVIQVSGYVSPIGELLQAKHIFVIPHGIPDVSANSAAQLLHKENKHPRILYVGMLHEEKGVSVLIEAARILIAGGHQFNLALVGDFSSSAYRDKVYRTIREYQLSTTVLVLGEKVGDDKWQAYREADILCFPTFYARETFGQVVLEAMAFSLPVVASRWRGTQDTVVDGVTGYLVPPRDPTSLADRLGVLASDPQLRLQMGRAARDRYLREFNVEKWYERIEQAFLTTAEDPVR